MKRNERLLRYLTVKLDKYGVKYNDDKRSGRIGSRKKKETPEVVAAPAVATEAATKSAEAPKSTPAPDAPKPAPEVTEAPPKEKPAPVVTAAPPPATDVPEEQTVPGPEVIDLDA